MKTMGQRNKSHQHLKELLKEVNVQRSIHMHNLVKDEIPEEDEVASPGCDNYYASLPTSIMDNHGLGRGGVHAGVSPQSHDD